ncbi:hypothetical protein RvY_10016 [Ramazzottius varieornatus]|uniref:Uncharacterized protein n=1 Tax=Ramazzottius varieornatus TaxID=947166 RepID=A0A1D1VBD2_RAMVA|nr:hypothetical protein RvY_10016 [Ramazzottius varieornatus]
MNLSSDVPVATSDPRTDFVLPGPTWTLGRTTNRQDRYLVKTIDVTDLRSTKEKQIWLLRASL